MRLVDDDEIEAARDKALGVLACDEPQRVEAITRCCAQKASGSLRSSASWLVAKVMPNLVSISSRHCPTSDAGASIRARSGHAAQRIFLQHHAGFDRLAETDLVGQQHPAAKLLEHLANRLDLVPEGLDPAQRRQAKQFVEALRTGRDGQSVAQPEPAPSLSGAFCRAVSSGARSSSAVNGISMSISGSPAGAGGMAGGSAAGERRALVSRLTRLELDRAPDRAPLGVGGRPFATCGLVASENPVVLMKKPFPPCPATGKILQSDESIGEPVGFQNGTRRFERCPCASANACSRW